MRNLCGRLAVAAVVVSSVATVTTGVVPVPGAPAGDPAGAQSGGVTGIDVASWQHPNGQPINWGAVRSAGHSFAFIKATEGASAPGRGRYTNPWFAQDWVGAGSAGLYRGAYHYAQPTANPGDAVADARHFIAATGTMNGAGDLPPVLDLEEHKGLAPAQIAAWASAWLGEVQRLTGRQPMIYTGPYFWKDRVQSTAFGGYRLWIASYGASYSLVSSQVPAGWSSWTIWQHTSSGTVPGIIGPVDLNRFCCDPGTLAALAAGGGPPVGNPYGNLDVAQRLPGGTVEVKGWTIDPDRIPAIRIHAYAGGPYGAGGRYAGRRTAGASRPDVGRVYPQYGSNHGYVERIAMSPTERDICIYAINEGPGNANPLLGCRQPSSNPIGNVDTVTVTGGRAVQVTGWAADPDTTSPLPVHVYANGRYRGARTAGVARPDLAAVYGPTVVNHGFDAPVTVPAGRQEICVYAINAGTGTTNPLLGCRIVNVPDVSPIGSLDMASAAPGRVAVSGWAIDPDAPGPVAVSFSVDGAVVGGVSTGVARSDVTRAYPFASNPGFTTTLSVVGSGTRTLCATATNSGAGTAQSLGCRAVTLSGSPFGNVDGVTAVPGGVQVGGWVIDPDTASPIAVHIYVNNRYRGAPTANLSRPDVGAAYPAFGDLHGYARTITGLAPGAQEVCVYAINVGPPLPNPRLACRTVTVTAP